MEFRDLRAVLTEDTRIDLVIPDWKDENLRELLPKPVNRNDNDALKGFGRYAVTKIVPLDYKYVKVHLDPGVKSN